MLITVTLIKANMLKKDSYIKKDYSTMESDKNISVKFCLRDFE